MSRNTAREFRTELGLIRNPLDELNKRQRDDFLRMEKFRTTVVKLLRLISDDLKNFISKAIVVDDTVNIKGLAAGTAPGIMELTGIIERGII